MICNVWYLFFFVIGSVITAEDVFLIQQNKGNILCRGCGGDISATDFIFSKLSTNSRYSFNDLLFNKDEVLVQVFSTDVIFHYPVISFTYSTCVPTGEWEYSTPWFPGYRWKPCACSECGAFIGFIFDPIHPGLVEPSKPFYGLILTTIISEHFLNTLTEYPSNISSD